MADVRSGAYRSLGARSRPVGIRDAAGRDRERAGSLFGQLALGRARMFRTSLANTENNIVHQLIPYQEDANFFVELKYGASAIEPPYFPYPAPMSPMEPRTPCETEFRGAVEAGVARQEQYGIKRRRPSRGRVAAARLRSNVAGK